MMGFIEFVDIDTVASTKGAKGLPTCRRWPNQCRVWSDPPGIALLVELSWYDVAPWGIPGTWHGAVLPSHDFDGRIDRYVLHEHGEPRAIPR